MGTGMNVTEWQLMDAHAGLNSVPVEANGRVPNNSILLVYGKVL